MSRSWLRRRCAVYTNDFYSSRKRGEKGYTLLREVLRKTGRVGIANVVIRSKQHLAALIPLERMLLMNTLRFANEIRAMADLNPPEDGKAGLSDKEIVMAERLVDDMTEKESRAVQGHVHERSDGADREEDRVR